MVLWRLQYSTFLARGTMMLKSLFGQVVILPNSFIHFMLMQVMDTIQLLLLMMTVLFLPTLGWVHFLLRVVMQSTNLFSKRNIPLRMLRLILQAHPTFAWVTTI